MAGFRMQVIQKTRTPTLSKMSKVVNCEWVYDLQGKPVVLARYYNVRDYNWMNHVYKGAAINGNVKAQRFWLYRELSELSNETFGSLRWYMELCDVYGLIVKFDMNVDIERLRDQLGRVPLEYYYEWQARQLERGRELVMLPDSVTVPDEIRFVESVQLGS